MKWVWVRRESAPEFTKKRQLIYPDQYPDHRVTSVRAKEEALACGRTGRRAHAMET
jgi:hypothetical protein